MKCLKIRSDFFENKTVKKILKHEIGATIIIIYMKHLQGISLEDEDKQDVKIAFDILDKFDLLKIDSIKAIESISCRNRNDPNYKQWRTSVFKRDSYTCKKCGHQGSKLNAHHIKSWSKYIESRFDIDNGVSLCVDCHKKEHKRDKNSTSNSSNFVKAYIVAFKDYFGIMPRAIYNDDFDASIIDDTDMITMFAEFFQYWEDNNPFDRSQSTIKSECSIENIYIQLPRYALNGEW